MDKSVDAWNYRTLRIQTKLAQLGYRRGYDVLLVTITLMIGLPPVAEKVESTTLVVDETRKEQPDEDDFGSF